MPTFIQNLSQHTIWVTSICNGVKHYTVTVVWNEVRISRSLGCMQHTVVCVQSNWNYVPYKRGYVSPLTAGWPEGKQRKAMGWFCKNAKTSHKLPFFTRWKTQRWKHQAKLTQIFTTVQLQQMLDVRIKEVCGRTSKLWKYHLITVDAWVTVNTELLYPSDKTRLSYRNVMVNTFCYQMSTTKQSDKYMDKITKCPRKK